VPKTIEIEYELIEVEVEPTETWPNRPK